MRQGSLGVVGAGLIGGSILLAARQRLPSLRRFAHDAQPETERALVERGLVEACLPLDELARRVDLLVVCVPPSAVDATLAAVAAAPLVTDAVSCKASVLEAARQHLPGGRFVGAHPMAGSERSGHEAASGQLFVGRRVYICAPPEASPEAVAAVESFWRALGGVIERIEAGEHDRKMAWVSHGVHATAAALARAVGQIAGLEGSAGTGFVDTTRVAAGKPGMWSEILLANRAPVLTALDGVAASLQALRARIEASDAAGLRALLEEAAAARAGLLEALAPPSTNAEYDDE